MPLGSTRPRRCAPLLLGAFVCAGVLSSSSPVAAQSDAVLDTTALEHALLEEMRGTRTPGVAVAVVSGDSIIYQKGFGRASAEQDTPVTPETLFRIGSVTKTFTGLAAAIIADEGKLDFRQPIGRFAKGPPLDPAIASLTLHQLLSHTAGVIQEPAGDGSHDDAALGVRVRRWGREHVFAEPGDVYSYSSPGYWLAGFVLEQVDDRHYADVLDERIFTPLGMTRSTLRPTMALTWPLAQDHRASGGGEPRVVRPYPDDASTWPGGSVYSSARELARFAIAFMNGGRIDGKQALPAGAITAMSTRQSTGADGACGYTYGLSHCTRRGVLVLSHYGFRSGSGAVLTMAPERRFAVIVLANRNGAIFGATEQKAMELMLPLAPEPADPPPTIAAFADAERGRLAGDYVAGGDTLRLVSRGGKLYYRFGDSESEARRFADGAIAILGPTGEPAQRFMVVRGRRGRAVYLHDGLNAFRKTDR